LIDLDAVFQPAFAILEPMEASIGAAGSAADDFRAFGLECAVADEKG
jgi:hypothetical protein